MKRFSELLPLLLVVLWTIYLAFDRSIDWQEVAATLCVFLNLLAHRWLQAREVMTLHASELSRLEKLEDDVANISGSLSISSGRMF